MLRLATSRHGLIDRFYHALRDDDNEFVRKAADWYEVNLRGCSGFRIAITEVERSIGLTWSSETSVSIHTGLRRQQRCR